MVKVPWIRSRGETGSDGFTREQALDEGFTEPAPSAPSETPALELWRSGDTKSGLRELRLQVRKPLEE